MKLKLFFAFIGIVIIQKNVSAQQSILTDISQSYIDKLIAVAKANYPEIKANESKITEAKANLGKTSISYLDALSISYIYEPQGYTNGINNASATGSQNYNYFQGIQAGIFFNIGTFFEKPYEVKAAKQEVEIATDQQDEYLLNLVSNIKKRYYTYVQGIATLKLVTDANADALEILTDVKHKFQKGEETFDDYTRAQLSLTASYQQKISAETNLLIAKADLEELLGEKLEDVK